jgi:hypothetical protein
MVQWTLISKNIPLLHRPTNARQLLEADPIYIDFQKSDCLLSNKWFNYANDLISKSNNLIRLLYGQQISAISKRITKDDLKNPDAILNMLENSKDIFQKNFRYPSDQEDYSRLIKSLLITRKEMMSPSHISDIIRLSYELSQLQKSPSKMKRQLISIYHRIQQLEQQIKKMCGTTRHLCQDFSIQQCACGGFKIAGSTIDCIICEGESSKDISIPCRVVTPIFKSIFTQNVWLELSIVKLLRQLGYRPIAGHEFIGGSLTSHEIDILFIANSPNIWGIIECINRNIDRQEISYVFSSINLHFMSNEIST